MTSVLTFKLPPPLLDELDHAAKLSGISKGEVIRRALGQYLQESDNLLQQITHITHAMQENRDPHVPVDWDLIYRRASKPSDFTPEEEVRCSRRRRM